MRSCLAVSRALVSLALILPAQDNLGCNRISGDVTDESGAKVAAALVVVESLPGGTRLEARTEKKGHFAVGSMGTGAWRVTVSKEGYLSASTDVQVSQIKTNPPVILTLKKASGSETLPADEAGRALLDRGNALLKEGRPDEALAAKIRKDWPKAYHRLGLVYLNKGDLAKALENLKKFLELDPQNPEAANVRAAIAAIEQIKK